MWDTFVERIVYPIVSRFIGGRMEGLINTQIEEGATDEFARRYRMGAFGVVAKGPHLCHIDLIVQMPAMRKLRKVSGADGYLAPISVTLINGRQAEAGRWYKSLDAYLDSNRVEVLPVVTQNDYKRFLTDVPNPEVIRHSLDAINLTAAKRMLNARRDNKIILILPEGTVKAGRNDENGQINGMRKVEDTTLARILAKHVERSKKSEGKAPNFAQKVREKFRDLILGKKIGYVEDFVVLPEGIWGSETLLNPTTYKANPEALTQLKSWPFLGERKTFANSKIEQPFGKDEYRDYLATEGKLDKRASDFLLARFMKEFPDTFFDFLMGEKIAPMIPLEYQGYYKKPDPILEI